VRVYDCEGLELKVSINAKWNNKSETTVEPKLNRLCQEIDDIPINKKVSLVGISASGSLVGLAFMERKKRVNNVVNICGRLSPGGILLPLPPLWLTSLRRPAFNDSVLRFHTQEPRLSSVERKQFLIYQARFDQLVPTSTNNLEGADKIKLPSITHESGIKDALTKYSKDLIHFLS
jgi:hypothetical protein